MKGKGDMTLYKMLMYHQKIENNKRSKQTSNFRLYTDAPYY